MLTFRALLAVLCALALAPVASAGPWQHSGLSDDEPAISADDPSLRAAAEPPKSVGSQAGCRTDFIEHNFSSRGGSMPRIFVLHYTVSRNVDGWGDVNAIRGLFNRDSFDASSNYIIDREAHCAYIVNEAAKAWTQTFYNPWAISIEFIATGRESRDWWRKSPGLRKGAAVVADAMARWDLPVRFVNPSASCTAPPRGVTDHDSLDCQNSHTDVKPNFPIGRFMNLVEAARDVRFILADGEGHKIGQSAAVSPGGAAEAERYASFLRSQRVRVDGLQELRRDGDIVIRRRKA